MEFYMATSSHTKQLLYLPFKLDFWIFGLHGCKPQATGCTPREWQDVQPLIPALGRPQLGKVFFDRPSFERFKVI